MTSKTTLAFLVAMVAVLTATAFAGDQRVLHADSVQLQNGSNYVQLQAPTLGSNVTFTFPSVSLAFPTVSGTANYVLRTDGAGVTTWVDALTTLHVSDATHSGYLSSTDWTAFNSGIAGSVPTTRTISTTAPLQGGGDLSANRTLSITQAATAANGYLGSTDWNTFNNKVATTEAISTTAPLTGGGDLSAPRTLAITQSGAAANGYLSSTDWASFNTIAKVMTTAGDVIYGGVSGAPTRLADGSSTQVLHSGATPSWAAVSLTADVTGVLPVANVAGPAATAASGYLSSTDWNTFNGKAASGANADITSLSHLAKAYPASNGTSALQITKADGSTVVMNVDTTNSRVGIGSATPSYQLTVDGGSLDAASGNGVLNVVSNPTNYGPEVRLNNLSSGHTWLFVSGGSGDAAGLGNLGIQDGGTNRLMIDTSGNVGIGTTTAGSKLTVNGAIESLATGFKFPNGTTIAQQTDSTHNGYLTSTDWTAFNGKLTSPLATKGDILTFSTVPAAMAVGSNGTVLSADSTQTTGLKWVSALTNPMTTLGDVIYEDATPQPTRLAGNTTSTKKFLTQTGTGSVSAVPTWGTIAAADLPAASSSAAGSVSYEDSGTFSATFTGPCSSGALSVHYSRVGKNVCLFVPGFSCTSSVGTSFAAGAGTVPSALRPTTANVITPGIVQDVGVSQTTPGTVSSFTNGDIEVFKNYASANFSSSGTAALIVGASICYTIN